ncbi:TRAP transporter substrate-binding protein [Histophilus somni]|uniref:TRAP transporter substrate-binding protein n=1 Tax=Histophilus somni TaxID=731 RepID=UPI00094B6705|nr:TRAP transporter substrate-binding protein [Histophilus somni]QQF85645.1 TRAP transporter substrate-binding protein [Histophilus somni]
MLKLIGKFYENCKKLQKTAKNCKKLQKTAKNCKKLHSILLTTLLISLPVLSQAKTLRLAHHMANDNVNHTLVIDFSDKLKEISNGKLTVDVYSNGILGDQVELFEGMKLGTVDMSISDTSIIASYYSPIGILDMPYFFKDMEHIKKLLNTAKMAEIKKQVEAKSGVKILSIQPVAYRNIILKKELADNNKFDGLKIRVPNSPVLVNTITSLGATPSPIPSGEAYTAIQTGVVDGMEGNPEFLSSIKISEVAKNWYETQHAMTFTALNISAKKFNSLTESEQQWIKEAVTFAIDQFYIKTVNTDEKWRSYLKQQGVEFHNVDIPTLREKAKPMVDKFVQANGLEELYKEAQK